MEEYFPADRLLKFEMGSVVQINREDNENIHFSTTLVGIDENHSVITSLPAQQFLPDGATYESIFTVGTMFEMKTIYDGQVVAFESSVISIYNNRLLISSYPEMIEARRLRQDTRFPCALSCDIRLNSKEFYGVISDISNGGCQMSVQHGTDYSLIEEALNTQDILELEVFFPFSEHPTVIAANVKSSTCLIDGACKVGLAFTTNQESVRKYLESLQLDSVSPFFH